MANVVQSGAFFVSSYCWLIGVRDRFVRGWAKPTLSQRSAVKVRQVGAAQTRRDMVANGARHV